MRVALALLALGFGFGGCALADFAKDAPAPRPPPRACAQDSDCAAGRHEVCRLADGRGTPTLATDGGRQTFDGVCVIPSGASAGEVFLEVRPIGDAVPVAQLGPIRLADGQNQPILVPGAVPVAGVVTYHGTQPPQPVKRARLKFRLTSLIPDRPLVFEATSGGEEDDLPGHFARLLPTGKYNLVVLPPTLTNLELKPPGERPLPDGFDVSDLAGKVNVFEVSNPNELVTFSGKATLQQDGQLVPAANVQVWAMSAATDDGSRNPAGRPVAQPVTTDADGKFTLWLPRLGADGEGHQIRLQFGPAPDGAPFPTFLDPTVYTVNDRGAQPANPPPSGRVDSPVEIRGRVVAPSRLGIAQGVPNARVTFRTVDRKDAPFSYTVTVIADDEGRYTAKLFPSIYTALALPPPDSDLEVGLCPLDTGAGEFVPEAGVDRGFLCEQRFSLFGEVRSDRAKVERVAVEAVRRTDVLVPDEIRVRATTDEAGTFALGLPRGTYDITLTAPADRKLPVKVLRGIVMPPPADQTLESIVVEMDPPFELFGKLFSGDEQHPLAATIEAYAVDKDGSSLLVGQSIAKDDGAYSLVLPAAP